MTYYDDIYELAVDNHYLITTKQARAAGIPNVELAKLAHRGKLVHLGNGVYRLTRYVPSEWDSYAIAVARVGEDAYLYGESVIALLGLAPTDPSRIYVATPKRVRKQLPDSIRLVSAPAGDTITHYEGVLSQHIANAISSARQSVMEERLRAAYERACDEGFLTGRQAREVEGKMGWA